MPLSSFPRAIVHVDGDAFFASCEQAVNPSLRGKPVVTGAERGIVTAASYEAKAKGVSRGVPLSKVRELCPDVIFVESHYDVYADFAERMFAIMRRYTPYVEEYSIDEAFADITGFDKPWHASYEQIARRMQEVIKKELEISVSVGLSVSKVLAKVGSKHKKPFGFTSISIERIEAILRETPVIKVWGLGPATAFKCQRLGFRTAFDFAQAPIGVIRDHFAEPVENLWHELRGESILPLVTDAKTSYASISKFETFRPPTNSRTLLFSRLIKNLENACAKARRYDLVAPRVAVLLRTQSMHTHGMAVTLPRPTSLPPEIASSVEKGFQKLYNPRESYRATGVVLFHLQPESGIQTNLFESSDHVDKWRRVYAAVDRVNTKQGHHTIHLARTSIVRQPDIDRDAHSVASTKQIKESNYTSFHFDPY